MTPWDWLGCLCNPSRLTLDDWHPPHGLATACWAGGKGRKSRGGARVHVGAGHARDIRAHGALPRCDVGEPVGQRWLSLFSVPLPGLPRTPFCCPDMVSFRACCFILVRILRRPLPHAVARQARIHWPFRYFQRPGMQPAIEFVHPSTMGPVGSHAHPT